MRRERVRTTYLQTIRNKYGYKRTGFSVEYIPVEAAKVIFHYSIYREKDNRLAATGSTTQVFLDSQYRLVLYNPDFYTAWKKKNNVL